MNCIELFEKRVSERPHSMALLFPGQSEVTFNELRQMAVRAQSTFRSYGLVPSDSVLVFDSLSVQLYASLIAFLSMGVTVIFVEPWMPLMEIQKIIALSKPKLFLSNWIGFAWGAQVSEIRKIPNWVRASAIHSGSSQGDLQVESVDSNTPGILTFTSGTTGSPKGVVRTQGYMVQQHEVLSRRLGGSQLKGPDLCIFANFAISNLADGRGSIIVPPSWKPSILKKLDGLRLETPPESLVAGPAFLLELLKYAKLPSLKSIHIGGALTDCWIFEKGLAQWPEAHWTHVYGGSEVEPVALGDVRTAVQKSRAAGYFQTLFLGNPVDEIRSQFESEGLWVAGPHVCPEYFANERENRLFKRKDATGVVWHFMGDRIAESSTGWWYQGRSGETPSNFRLEQTIYQELQSSKCMIRSQTCPSTGAVKTYLVGEGLIPKEKQILRRFPEISGVIETPVFRDRRHRARIDRKKTIEQGARWLVG